MIYIIFDEKVDFYWSRSRVLERLSVAQQNLPEGVTRLATRETCPNQAFRVGNKTYAFQFHLEVTRGILDGWSDYRANALQVPREEIAALIEPQIAAKPDDRGALPLLLPAGFQRRHEIGNTQMCVNVTP